ncbi:hypothetical protein [Halosegnis marinus]|uniref:hypothetical protein n=1 Tax=Halosegnis marinus TaxID=3034023 RepID=UPI0036D24805
MSPAEDGRDGRHRVQQAAGVVRLAGNAQVVTPYLDFTGTDAVDDELSWSHRYLALSAVGVGTLVPVAVVGSALAATVAFACLVAAFGTCSLVHCREKGAFAD